LERWQKESLGLQVGDSIIWQGEAIEFEAVTLMVDELMRWEKAT